MTYLYFPGCSLRSTGRAYEESMLAVFRALEIPLEELEDWNCCGATAYFSTDEHQAFAIAARNLAIGEIQAKVNGTGPVDIIAPCSACFLVLSKTQRYLAQYPEVYESVTSALKAGGLVYHGKVRVRHPLDVLVNDIGLKAVAAKVRRPLKGIRIASYYGCQMTRPFTTFDDPFYPTTMDSLMRALGAEPVDWALKTRCCGGSLTGTIPEAGLRLNRALLKEMGKQRIDVAVTYCPLCQHNLECYQGRINREYHEDIHMPIAYFTQVMGMALDIPDRELGIHRLFRKLPHPAPRKEEAAHV
jgi:heterodisulfide reductase subunit B